MIPYRYKDNMMWKFIDQGAVFFNEYAQTFHAFRASFE